MSELPPRDDDFWMATMSIRRAALTLAVIVSAACSSNDARHGTGAAADSAGRAATAAVASAPSAECPPTGLWARCSVMYRLERTGLAPRLDSAASVGTALREPGFVVKIGTFASLDVYLFADSAARVAAEQLLDRSRFVMPGAPLTMRHEQTLIENANLVGVLTSLNDRQRERISDALVAGPPQAPTHTP